MSRDSKLLDLLFLLFLFLQPRRRSQAVNIIRYAQSTGVPSELKIVTK